MRRFLIISATSLMFFSSCNNDAKIIKLLQSKNKDDVILGAHLAGDKKDTKFVPLLLDNSFDYRISTHYKFKGCSVYQQKMLALKRIYNESPPVKITRDPDSTVIKFYIELSKKNP